MDARARQDTIQAERLVRAGDLRGAVALLERAAKRSPRDHALLYNLGIAKGRMADHQGAMRAIQRAISVRDDVPIYHADLAQLYAGEGRFDDAERALDRALALDPDLTHALAAKIELLQLIGRFDDAAQVATAAVEAHPSNPRLAVAFARLAPRIDAERRAVDLLRAILERGAAGHPETEAFLNFRLADLLDRLGEHEDAFAAAARANALVPARFDPAAHAASADRMIGAWTPDAIRRLPRASRPTDRPILIVGMLRSGTSLVEQILACHPDVHAGGELDTLNGICAGLGVSYSAHEPRLEDPAALTRPALDQAQRHYLSVLHGLGAKSARRVTDKMPGNFAHLGLVSRMLPGARVIHCARDPLDTAVSCFFHKFQGAHHWTYRLEWIGAYWRDYRRIMDHWRAVLDDLPILDVPYEELTADPETWIPRIVGFAGLEWNDACLRFHESERITRTISNEQVRRPMYRSSVGRHAHYGAHLDPLRQALGATP